MKKDELEIEVRQLLQSKTLGLLSTYAAEESEDKAAGFPFGSMVRFVIAEDDEHKGQPILMLSRLAEHSKHIAQQNKVSLLVSADAENDIQQTARLTLLGEIHKLDADDPAIQQDGEIYFQQFPETREYFQLLDFDFYRLRIIKGRYIGGFARAHWLKGSQFTS
ncbi:hypothetical protein A9R00_08150 [Oleispira antarctica]|uniref:CREG-like beta-barrel domain-containing protein n=1 Tax=Oleispira antarctica TaxID=188908 RepID=A0A1Y5HRV9_OLEAN|nr:hypothetical protein A9R00_08150 [Oleispira antarctica]